MECCRQVVEQVGFIVCNQKLFLAVLAAFAVFCLFFINNSTVHSGLKEKGKFAVTECWLNGSVEHSIRRQLENFGQIRWTRTVGDIRGSFFVSADTDQVLILKHQELTSYSQRDGAQIWSRTCYDCLLVNESHIFKDSVLVAFGCIYARRIRPSFWRKLKIKDGDTSGCKSLVHCHEILAEKEYLEAVAEDSSSVNRVSHCGNYTLSFENGVVEKTSRFVKKNGSVRLHVSGEKFVRIKNPKNMIKRIYGIRIWGKSCSNLIEPAEWTAFSFRKRDSESLKYFLLVKWIEVEGAKESVIQAIKTSPFKVLWEERVKGEAIIQEGPFWIESEQAIVYTFGSDKFYTEKRAIKTGELLARLGYPHGFAWVVKENGMNVQYRNQLFSLEFPVRCDDVIGQKAEVK